MIGKEIYRILSRKITLIALSVAAAFSIYYGCISFWDEVVIDNGEIYWKSQAVAADRRATEEFTGTLTEENVRMIWEKYGEPVNADYLLREENLRQLLRQGVYDNCCNRFVSRMFTNEVTQENGTIVRMLQENLSENPYFDGSYVFGYVGEGWNWYWDHFLIILVMVSLVVIIGFSPVFSEDYAFRTADIILPTVKGRFQVWRTRISAGFLLASVYYWVMCGIAFFQNILFYGTDGLFVSCAFTAVPYYFQENSAPLWKALLVLHLGGWFSMLVLVLQIQAISSRCKSGFGTLLWSLAAYLGPIAVIRMVLDNLPVTRVIMWIKYFGYSMPLSFSGMYVQAQPLQKRVLLTIALVTAAAVAVAGALNWCRHQVKN